MTAKIEAAIYRLLQRLDRFAPPPVDPEDSAEWDAYRAVNRERRNEHSRIYNRKRREVRHAA